jgi:hypothetical protein
VKLAAAVVAALALLLVPAAGAPGPSISYTVTAGTAGTNGWYRSAVTVRIDVSSATDTTCPVVKTFQSNADSPWSCTATDGTATTSLTVNFKIDTDTPSVTGESTSRGPDHNGWFNHALTVAFAGSDKTSGIASCSSVAYSGPDSGSASVTGTCTDVAGNVSDPATYTFKYDSTPPTVTASAARAPDANGWFNHPVAVSFGGSDATSGVDTCSSATYSGPDNATASVAGSCVDAAGNSAAGSFALKYDATPPAVTLTPSRPPDSNGWYSHAVTFSASASDATSGIASCTKPAAYAGPDASSASVSGSCTDNAGNSATASAQLRYDSTPPKVTDLAVTAGAHTETLTWKASADTASIVITRAPGNSGHAPARVYDGTGRSYRDANVRAGLTYVYTLTARDAAGNVSTATVRVPVRALYAPQPGAVARAASVLAWYAKPGASYYNVQLFRNGAKVLSAWPTRPTFTLPSSWTFRGRPQKLLAGTYRWYVWPGHGAPSAARYGPLLGASSFVVRG